MTIDPRIQFWFGVWTSILLGIATGAVHLPTSVPAELASEITSWSAFLGWINGIIMTAMSGYSGPGAGPLVKPKA